MGTANTRRSSRTALPSLRRAALALLSAGAVLQSARAAPTTDLTVGSPKQCAPVRITWDMSKGTAPWTVTVAFTNHVPYTYRFPANYASSKSTWSYDYDVPSFRGGSPQMIVAVTDSTGQHAATSSFLNVASGGNCAVAQEKMDFVWYTQPNTQTPASCADLDLKWSKNSGQPGPTAPVVVTILPENDVPQSFQTSDVRNGYTWTNGLNPGTDFAILVTDNGANKNGGVGQRYTAGGKPRRCSAHANGGVLTGSKLLPAPGQTLGAGAGNPPASSSSSSAGASGTRTKSSSGPKPTGTTGAGSSSSGAGSTSGASSSHGSAGAAAGGAIGGIAAMVLIGVLIWYMRRRRLQQQESAANNSNYGFNASNGGGMGSLEQKNLGGSGSGGGSGWFGLGFLGRKQRKADLTRNLSQYTNDWGNAPAHSISMGQGGWTQQQVQQQHSVAGGAPPMNRSFSDEKGETGSSMTHDSRFDRVGAAFGPAAVTAAGAGAGAIRMTQQHSTSPPRMTRASESQERIHGGSVDGHSSVGHHGTGVTRRSVQLGSSPIQRGIFSTVPDDHLFPPPRPRPEAATHLDVGRARALSSSSAGSDHGATSPVLTTAQLARQAAPSAQWAPSPPFGTNRMSRSSGTFNGLPPAQNLPQVSSQQLYQATLHAAAQHQQSAYPSLGDAGVEVIAYPASSHLSTQQLQQQHAAQQHMWRASSSSSGHGHGQFDRPLSTIRDEQQHGGGGSRPHSLAPSYDEAEVIDLRHHQPQRGAQQRVSAFSSQLQTDARRNSYATRIPPPRIDDAGDLGAARSSAVRQSTASDASGTYLAYLDD